MMLRLSSTVRGIMTVFGGFLIHLSLGTLYTFGNMNPYVSSYLRMYSQSTEVLQTQTVWIFTLSVFGQGLFMGLGGLIERRLGCRLTTLLGGWIMSAGVLLTAVTIKVNLAATVVTYGFMFGLGTGIAYAVAISAAMSCFPTRKGLVGGIVVAGFGGGAFIFNQIQTHYINPDNLKPNVTYQSEYFFDDEDLLSRVPSCFLLIGSIYAAMQLIGSLLLSRPEIRPMAETDERTPITLEESEKDEEEEVERRDFHPMEMLKTRNFWVLWSTFLLNSICIVFISTLYKTFGEQFITDDLFLATVGSLSAVFNSLFRIVWGRLHDRFRYKWLMALLCFLLSALLCTFPQTRHLAGWGFLVWVCLLFGVFSGNFALFPAATSSVFGHQFMAINFGLLFTGNAVAGIVGATLTSLLSSRIGLDGVFYLGGGAALVGFFLTFLFRTHP